MPADFSIGRVRHGATPKPRKRAAPAPRIGSPLGPIGRADAPITRAQTQAHEATGRAQQALPKRPDPHIPRLNYPTQAQRDTANEIMVRARTKAAGGAPGTRADRGWGPRFDPAKLRAYNEELLQDPRHREYVATLQRYGRSTERRGQAHAGREATKTYREQHAATKGQSGSIPAFDTTATKGQSGTIGAFDTRPQRERDIALGALQQVIGAQPELKVGIPRAPAEPELQVAGVDIPNLGALPAKLAEIGRVPASAAAKVAAYAGFGVGGMRDPGVLKLLEHGGKDVLDLTAGAIPSAWYMAEQIAKGDEMGLAQSMLDPYAQAVKDPKTAIMEHPVSTGLLFFGAGKGAGALARRGVAMTGASVADRRLVTATLPGTEAGKLRLGAKDLPTLMWQKRRDARNIAEADRLRALADEAEDSARDPLSPDYEAAIDEATSLRAKAAKKDPRTLTDDDIIASMDDLATATDAERRGVMNETLGTHRRAELGLDPDTGGLRATAESVRQGVTRNRPVASGAGRFLVAQGITRATRTDLENYAADIGEVAQDLRRQVKAAKTKEIKTTLLEKLKANEQLQQAIRRTLDEDPEALANLAEYAQSYRDIAGPLERELIDAGVLAIDRAERSALTPYAAVHMDAKYVPEHHVETATGKALTPKELEALKREHGRDDLHGRLVGGKLEPGIVTKVPEHWEGPDGKLSRQDIRDDMDANGYNPDPSYLPMKPQMRLRSMFYRNTLSAPHPIGGKTRTGKSATEGTYDTHPEVMRGHLAQLANLVGQVRGWSRVIGNFGLRRADGQLFASDHDGAVAAAATRTRETGIKHIPYRVTPFQGKGDLFHGLLEKTRADDPLALKPVHDAMVEALDENRGPEGYKGEWGVMPASAARRASSHLNVSDPNTAARAVQLIVGLFRKTVLATNPRWLFGNAFEAGLRAIVNQAGLRSHKTFMDVRKQIAEEHGLEAAEQFENAVVGVGMAGAALRHPKRMAEQWYDDPEAKAYTQRIARGMEAIRHDSVKVKGVPVNVAKGAAGLYKLITDGVLEGDARVARMFRRAQAGRGIREGIMGPGVRATSERAIKDAADGLTNTPAQQFLAKYVRDAYGKYDGYSPAMRWMIQTATPFIPWTISSLRFLGRVLPRDHPLLLSAIVSANEASREWRADHGLAKFIDGAAPGFLQGSIPWGPDGEAKVRVSRYTPFSIGSDPTGALGESVLPWLQPVIMAADGRDWKGDEKRDANGNPLDDIGKLQLSIWTFLGGVTPLLSQSVRAFSHEGGAGQGALHEINPFAPIRPKEGAGGNAFQQKYGTGGAGASRKDFQEKYGIQSGGLSREDFKKKYGLGG